MLRNNIFEILKTQYNVIQEMNKLVNLFSLPIIYYYQSSLYYATTTHKITIEELFNMEILPKWKQRGAYLNCQEIKIAIKFPKIFNNNTPTDTIINCLEYYDNILYLLITKFDIQHHIKYKYDTKCLHYIIENIRLIISNLNYERNINHAEEQVILIPKNPEAIAVAEITGNKDIAFAIIKYNHATLKGNLEGKKQLLLSIANEYEPLLTNPIDGFSDYFKKATFLLNNIHIRHNNKTGKDKKQVIIDMPDTELEKWYDELYQLILFCVLIKDNIKRKDKIDELIRTMNKK